MGRISKKAWIIACVWAIVCYAVVAVAAQLLIRNLYRVLPADTDFPAIFSQIRTAAMYTPFIPIFTAGALSCFLLSRICRSRYGWIAAAVLIPVLLLLLIAVGAFLTRVNDIRLGDILLSLLDMMEKGGLDGL